MKWVWILALTMACAPKVRGLEGALPAPTSANETLGQQVFYQRCHSCHPDGHAGLGPSTLTPPRFMVPLQVRLGLGAMPAFSREKIDREEMRALTVWIRRVDLEE